jgi:hypothetical protein
MRVARYVGLAVLAVLAVGLALPYINVNGYRERIQNALERALHRKVTVGKVHFELLTGPGFSVEDVTIGEDARIGIEPIAYVQSLTARVRLATLWTSKLSFSNLRLSEPTVNLSKAENGPWNFELLAEDIASGGRTADPPSIEVRSGRINFKFSDYKAIFYLADSDIDVTPSGRDRLDFRFSGQPSRTDQPAQNFGGLLGRGVWSRGPNGRAAMDANLELERSGISDLARLVLGHTIGVHGMAASRAHVSGPIDKLNVTGQLRLEDVHRWDLLPPKSGGWDLNYRGTADLIAQRIDLATDRKQDPDVPFLIRFRASDYLRNPKWAATLEVNDAPVSAFLEVGRHMGATLPDGLDADGKVAGLIGYSQPGGIEGQFVIRDSHVRLEPGPPLDIRSADIVIDGSNVRVGPGTVALGDGQTADVEGAYDASNGAADIHVTTKGMGVPEFRSSSGRLLGADAIPALATCRQGTWRGWIRYVRDGVDDEWLGAFELRSARFDIEGLRDPVRVTSAMVEVSGPRVLITQIKGRVGTIPFRGEYRRERANLPGRLRIEIAEAGLAELEQLFLPSLRRDTGLLARFHLRRPQLPGWLRTRNVDANVTIDKLTVADQVWTVDRMRVVWDGAAANATDITARSGGTEATGQVSVDLTTARPHYQFEGNVNNVEFHNGVLTVSGSGESAGTGLSMLANAKGSGTFSGDGLVLSPETEFESISGGFEFGAGGRLRLTKIQAVQADEEFSGQGGTQPDGRIILDLTGARHQAVRVAVVK